MTNTYAGRCTRCHITVDPGDGTVTRRQYDPLADIPAGWDTRHNVCPDPTSPDYWTPERIAKADAAAAAGIAYMDTTEGWA